MILFVPKGHHNFPFSIFNFQLKSGLLRSPVYLSSSALGAVVGTHGGQLGVRLGHESLQLFLEQLVCSLGGCGLDGRALGTALGGSILALETGILPAGSRIAAAEIVVGSGCILPGLTGLQALDGKVDLSVLISNDHNLHILALGQVLTDVADIGICHFGNMYHSRLVFRQRDECAEIGDCFDLAQCMWK